MTPTERMVYFSDKDEFSRELATSLGVARRLFGRHHRRISCDALLAYFACLLVPGIATFWLFRKWHLLAFVALDIATLISWHVFIADMASNGADPGSQFFNGVFAAVFWILFLAPRIILSFLSQLILIFDCSVLIEPGSHSAESTHGVYTGVQPGAGKDTST